MGTPALLAPKSTSTAVSVMPEKTYRTKVEIVEDKSDDLFVAEARIRHGLVDPVRPTLDKAYVESNRPKRVYYFSSVDKEIENPHEGSVVVMPGECKVMIQSQVGHSDVSSGVKTWSVFTKYGLTVTQPQAVIVRQDGTFDVATQVFRVNYADNADWGCLILRCCNDNLIYGKDIYKLNELLTIYFHRTREDFEQAPYPPMLTLARLADQNYVPILPGQMLQVVPNIGSTDIEDYQANGDRCLMFRNYERLTRNSKFWCNRYECVRIPDDHQALWVRGEQPASVILPPVHVDGKDVFCVVTEPYRSVKLDCNNITSMRLRFARNIPVIEYPTKFMEIPNANTQLHELNVRFLKKLGTVTIHNAKGTCSLSCTLPGFETLYTPAKRTK